GTRGGRRSVPSTRRPGRPRAHNFRSCVGARRSPRERVRVGGGRGDLSERRVQLGRIAQVQRLLSVGGRDRQRGQVGVPRVGSPVESVGKRGAQRGEFEPFQAGQGVVVATVVEFVRAAELVLGGAEQLGNRVPGLVVA